MKLLLLFLGSFSLLLSPLAVAKPESYQQYIANLQRSLVTSGLEESDVNVAFSGIKRFRTSRKNDDMPKYVAVGKFGFLDEYLPKVVNEDIVKKARAFYKDNLTALQDIEKTYHVQARFLVAQWGISNQLSTSVQGYDALSVITSLAHQKQQAATLEQIESLVMLAANKSLGGLPVLSDVRGKIGLLDMSPQQLLAGYQDFDSDGVVDVWNSPLDALASGSQFLSRAGWDDSQTWGRQVALPESFGDTLLNDGQFRSLSEWSKLGVTRFDKRALPNAGVMAKLVAPDGKKGRIYLAYKNFEYLQQLNDSVYNTIAVGYLSNRIKFPAIK